MGLTQNKGQYINLYDHSQLELQTRPLRVNVTGRIKWPTEGSENCAGVHKTSTVLNSGNESCVTATPAHAFSVIPQRRVK